MSEESAKVPQRLHWWFWVVLFTPAAVFVTIPLTRLNNALLIGLISLGLNFFCSNWVAKRIVLCRDSRGSSSPWMFLWGPLCFFLNVAVAWSGCTVLEEIIRPPR